MAIICTRCEGSGFLNFHTQCPLDLVVDSREAVLGWIAKNTGHDVAVCDCCGDGTEWYGEPGQHYTDDDPRGPSGPYAYNGGLCECN